MTEQENGDTGPRIIVDSDWKKDAAAEKERLAEELREAEAGDQLPDPSLLELVNMIVMQASISLGGYKSPEGQVLPPDIALAKHYIDLLDLLKNKTEGHRTSEETQIIDSVSHELRMHFVHVTSQPAARSSPAGTKSKPT